MLSFYLPFRDSTFYYTKAGLGKRWLICLHGYGENAETFSFLNSFLENEYTIVAIDAPFHGKTTWLQHNEAFTPAMLLAIIAEIVGSSSEKISIIGYSMGGRMALKLLLTDPERIDKLVLVAPDGLKFNFWHWLGTQTFIGNKIFKYTMLKNPLLFKLVQYIGKIGLVNGGVVKFAEQYLQDVGARKMLYKRWITMRKFAPERNLLPIIVEKFGIDIRMLFGKNDQIIKAKNGVALANKLPKLVRVWQIKAGHQLLKEKHIATFMELFFT